MIRRGAVDHLRSRPGSCARHRGRASSPPRTISTFSRSAPMISETSSVKSPVVPAGRAREDLKKTVIGLAARAIRRYRAATFQSPSAILPGISTISPTFQTRQALALVMARRRWRWPSMPLQVPSVGGCFPEADGRRGRRRCRSSLGTASPLIAQSVGRIWRRLGFSTRLSMRLALTGESVGGRVCVSRPCLFLPQTIATASVTSPPPRSATRPAAPA